VDFVWHHNSLVQTLNDTLLDYIIYIEFFVLNID
jgi:hypothetical protein